MKVVSVALTMGMIGCVIVQPAFAVEGAKAHGDGAPFVWHRQ